MLLAGRARHQARHAWIALVWTGQADPGLSRIDTLPSTAYPVGLAFSDSLLRLTSCQDQLVRIPSGPDCPGSLSAAVSATNDASRRSCMSSDCSTSISRTSDVSGSIAHGRVDTQYRRRPFHSACKADISLTGWGRFAPFPGPLSCRFYHSWYYSSKLRNRAINAATSLDQLEDMLRQDGDRLDHINLALFLRRLQLAATSEAAAASGWAPSTSSATSSSPPAAAAAPSGPSPSTAVAAAVAAATSRAVEQQVARLAAKASRLVRKRAKWFEPRYAAAVVYRTAALGLTDGRMLHELTGRTLARLNEAYSRDLVFLLCGLHAHAKMSAAAAQTSDAGAAADITRAAVADKKQQRRRLAAAALPYTGPPAALLSGVEAFILAKLPTGKMPPENVDGLLRHIRALSGRPAGPCLCAAAEEDLRRRLSIYGPQPLSGLLSTLAAEHHPLPLDLLAAGADQFTAHAAAYGTGAAAARLLAASAAILRNHANSQPPQAAALPADHKHAQQPAAAPGVAAAAGRVPSPSEWLSSRPELLAACLSLMARDLASASPERLSIWLQALAHAEAPLAALAASSESVSRIPPPATPASAPAAAVAFVAAHGAAVERALPGLGPEAVARLRKAYDAVGLPYPRGM